MARKKEVGNPEAVRIMGGGALILLAFLVNLVAPVLYRSQCQGVGSFYSGPCSFGDSILIGVLQYILVGIFILTGLILICIGVHRKFKKK